MAVENSLPSQETHWASLQDVAKIYKGFNRYAKEKQRAKSVLTSPPKDIPTESVGILNMSNVQNGSLCLDSLVHCDVSIRRLPRILTQPGDLIITNRGEGIKLCVVPKTGEKLAISQAFFGIRLDRSRFDPDFVYFYLTGPSGQAQLAKMQKKSSVKILRADDLKYVRLPVIPLHMQEQYVTDLKSMEREIDAIQRNLLQKRQQAYSHFYDSIKSCVGIDSFEEPVQSLSAKDKKKSIRNQIKEAKPTQVKDTRPEVQKRKKRSAQTKE